MNMGKYDNFFINEPIIPGKFAPKLKFNTKPYFGEKNYALVWNFISEPWMMESEPHSHDFDQFLHFYGGNASNVKEFKAVVELCLGEEHEKHIITSTTIVHVPKGMIHCPLNIIKVDKPIIFMNIVLAPEYNKLLSQKHT
jgi:hypothetical protein